MVPWKKMAPYLAQKIDHYLTPPTIVPLTSGNDDNVGVILGASDSDPQVAVNS